MRGTTPAVLIVTRRFDIPNARSSMSTPAASVTASKFNSGSPIPMNTTLVMLRSSLPARIRPSPAAISARHTWPTISARLRLPLKPRLPVAQKLQSRAQPTWDEMHRVLRRDEPSSPFASGMSTASTAWPEPTSTGHLTTPSAAWLAGPNSGARISAMSCRRARRAFEMSVME